MFAINMQLLSRVAIRSVVTKDCLKRLDCDAVFVPRDDVQKIYFFLKSDVK
jgi:hypothetical protein